MRNIMRSVRTLVILAIIIGAFVCCGGGFIKSVDRPTLEEGTTYVLQLQDGQWQTLTAFRPEAGILIDLEDRGDGFFRATLLNTGEEIVVRAEDISYQLTPALATIPWGIFLYALVAVAIAIWVWQSFTAISIPDDYPEPIKADYFAGLKDVTVKDEKTGIEKEVKVASKGNVSATVTVFFKADALVKAPLIPNPITLLRYWLARERLKGALSAQVVGSVQKKFKTLTPLNSYEIYAFAETWVQNHSRVVRSLEDNYGVGVTSVHVSRLDDDTTAMQVKEGLEELDEYARRIEEIALRWDVPQETVAKVMQARDEARAAVQNAQTLGEAVSAATGFMQEWQKAAGGIAEIGRVAPELLETLRSRAVAGTE